MCLFLRALVVLRLPLLLQPLLRILQLSAWPNFTLPKFIRKKFMLLIIIILVVVLVGLFILALNDQLGGPINLANLAAGVTKRSLFSKRSNCSFVRLLFLLPFFLVIRLEKFRTNERTRSYLLLLLVLFIS